MSARDAGPCRAYLDVLDGDHARLSFPLHALADGTPPPPLRLGRQLDADIVLDDPHLAGEHALLQLTEQGAELTLLPSLNGAVQGRRQHRAGARLAWASDEVIQLGHTRLRLRHAAAPLAPERPMLHAPRWLGVLLLALAAFVLSAWDTWRRQEPGAGWMAYAGPVLGLGAMVLAWAALWALLTQLFQRRFPYGLHLRRALVYLVGVLAVTDGLPMLAFVASAPALLHGVALLPPLGAAALVYWHARDVWPRARAWLLGTLLCALAVWLANGWTRQAAQQHRWRDPYLATLLPPGLRAAPLRSVDALLADAAELRATLAAKAKQDENGEDDGGAEGEE